MAKLKRPYDPYEKYKVLVHGKMDVLGLSCTMLAEKMDSSRNTMSKYLREPEQMSLGMLRRLNRILEIPAEEARAALPMV